VKGGRGVLGEGIEGVDGFEGIEALNSSGRQFLQIPQFLHFPSRPTPLLVGILPKMADWDALVDGFRFDFWANRLWLESLSKKAFPEPDAAVMAHLLSAQKIWVTRVNGESLDYFPKVELKDEAMAALNSEWLEALANRKDDPIIHYRRTTGEALTSPLSQIALHVINHGTYHRGELRGLLRAREDVDFPETDRLRYWFETHQ